MSNNEYFALLPKEDIVSELEDKVRDYYLDLEQRGTMRLYAKSYDLYNVAVTHSPEISTVGDNQQFKRIYVNQYRNFIQHLLNLTISQRPAFEPHSTNTDVKSQKQTILAKSLLEYYNREKHIERNLRQAVEQSLTFGESFVTVTWNATTGEVYAVDPDTGAERQAGDIECNTYEPVNVIRDVHLHSWADNQWIILRRLVNKYDLAAKYFEMSDLIVDVTEPVDPRTTYRPVTSNLMAQSDLISVYDFYHDKSESMPNGRLVSYVNSEIVLMDGPLPYRDVPVYRITPSDITGSTHGYSPAFDLIALQDGLNDLHSTILTNQLTFGVQNVTVPTGCNVSGASINGMQIINYNPSQGKPEALNLTSTPVEIFNYAAALEHTMETISGVNSVARGNPEASLKSGAALALVQSMSIQFAQPLQQSYVQLIEAIGTAIINTLRDYAAVPRIAAITGKHNQSLMREFTGDDLAQVNRVTVDVGNPMSQTTAGRVELAQNLLQGGFLKTSDEFLMVINTGSLEPMIEGKTMELLAIRSENESLADGKQVTAMITDEHLLHIMEHKAIISDPVIREDGTTMSLVTQHIMDHFAFLQNPKIASLLTLIGQTPVAATPQAPPAGPMGPTQGSNLPIDPNQMVQQSLPSPPNMPRNPLTGQKAPMPNSIIPPAPIGVRK